MWTLAVLIWLPIAGLLILVALVFGILFLRGALQQRRSFYEDTAEYYMGAGVCLLLVLGLAIGTAWGMWPWKAEFHRWQEVNGHVETVSSRFLPGANSGTEQKFVVVLDSHPGQPYAIQDTRAALLRKGDQVSLRCKRTYQYQSDSGWDCRWNGGNPTGGAS